MERECHEFSYEEVACRQEDRGCLHFADDRDSMRSDLWQLARVPRERERRLDFRG